MQPPFIVADASAHQGADPNWQPIVDNCVGLILKATEGTYYAPDWFVTHWDRVRELAGGRYGDSFFRGAYHFLDCRAGTYSSGKDQAHAYLAHIAKAGGWRGGDMLPFVDVELGGVNAGLTDAEGIKAVVSGFATTVRIELGRDVVLYGRGAMRDLGINSRMGCSAVWNPGYTATMPLNGLTPAWSVSDVVLWQYTDGRSIGNSSLPQHIDGFEGGLDLSVYVDGNRKPTLSSLRRRLLGSADMVLATLFFATLLTGALA
jgi:GH25 family lysozyme M1 (1,4-beta-N-acetylmuramidase)